MESFAITITPEQYAAEKHEASEQNRMHRECIQIVQKSKEEMTEKIAMLTNQLNVAGKLLRLTNDQIKYLGEVVNSNDAALISTKNLNRLKMELLQNPDAVLANWTTFLSKDMERVAAKDAERLQKRRRVMDA